MDKPSVQERQKPLREEYATSPGAAMVTDHARTTGVRADDPFHCVTVQGSRGCERSYGRRSEGTVPPSMCAEQAWVMKSWTQRSA